MALTAAAVKQARPRDKTYKLSEGKGLHLQVEPKGGRYWRMAYRFGGKQKTLALGVYPDVTLSDARDLAFDAKKLLKGGTDPSKQKKLDKVASNTDDSFRSVALSWYEKQLTGSSDRHKRRAMGIFNNDLFTEIGDSKISDITAPDLLAALEKIETRGAIDMAHRARGLAGQVFRFGIASGSCDRDVAADLRGALTKKPDTKHQAAITDPAEVGKLLIAIDGYMGTPTVCAALKLSPLLFQRPGEVRAMAWDEINWKDELWEIPAERMKMQHDHIVPLSTQALAVLKDIHRITGRGRYVFPSVRGASRPLSDNGVRTALRTMGYDNETMSAHGFRAMARTLLDERLKVRVDIIEHQLAHAVKDPTGRAYNRTTFIDERKVMMQQWADYLDELAGEVLKNGK
jgi:integrase